MNELIRFGKFLPKVYKEFGHSMFCYTVFTVCVASANTRSLDFALPFATQTAALRSG